METTTISKFLDDALSLLPEGHGVTRSDMLHAFLELEEEGELDKYHLATVASMAKRIGEDRMKEEEARRPAKPGEAPYFQAWSGDRWEELVKSLGTYGMMEGLYTAVLPDAPFTSCQIDRKLGLITIEASRERRADKLILGRDGSSEYYASSYPSKNLHERVWECLYSMGFAVRRFTAEGPAIPSDVLRSLRLKWAWTGNEWVASTTGPEGKEPGLCVVAYHGEGGYVYAHSHGGSVYEGSIPEYLCELCILNNSIIPEGVHYLQHAESKVFELLSALATPVLQDAINLTEEIVASARKNAESPVSMAGFANTRIHQGRAVLHEAGRILEVLKGGRP